MIKVVSLGNGLRKKIGQLGGNVGGGSGLTEEQKQRIGSGIFDPGSVSSPTSLDGRLQSVEGEISGARHGYDSLGELLDAVRRSALNLWTQQFRAAQGQREFVLDRSIANQPLAIYLNGILVAPAHEICYEVIGDNTVRFLEPLSEGDVVVISSFDLAAGGSTVSGGGSDFSEAVGRLEQAVRAMEERMLVAEINIIKTNFKINAQTEAYQERLHQLVIDLFNEMDGLDEELSYCYYDATLKHIERFLDTDPGIAISTADELDEWPSRLHFLAEYQGDIDFFFSLDDGDTWHPISSHASVDTSGLERPNGPYKLRIKAELAMGAILTSWAWGWHSASAKQPLHSIHRPGR